MGNYAGQAPVAELSTLSRSELEATATSLRVACRDERKRKKTKRQLQEDCRLAIEAQHFAMQQEARRCRRGTLDVGGSTSEGASSLSAAPACAQEAERTQTVSGYAGASTNAAVTTANFDAQGLARGGHRRSVRSGMAKSTALRLKQWCTRAISLGVARRDESNRTKSMAQLKEDCRLALEAQQSEVNQECRRSGSALGGGNALGAAVAELSSLNLGQLRARATSLGVCRRDGNKMQKRRYQLEEGCRIALEAQQSKVQSAGALCVP